MCIFLLLACNCTAHVFQKHFLSFFLWCAPELHVINEQSGQGDAWYSGKSEPVSEPVLLCAGYCIFLLFFMVLMLFLVMMSLFLKHVDVIVSDVDVGVSDVYVVGSGIDVVSGVKVIVLVLMLLSLMTLLLKCFC